MFTQSTHYCHNFPSFFKATIIASLSNFLEIQPTRARIFKLLEDQKSILRNQFSQPLYPGGPVQQPCSSYLVPIPHRLFKNSRTVNSLPCRHIIPAIIYRFLFNFSSPLSSINQPGTRVSAPCQLCVLSSLSSSCSEF